MSKKKKTKTKFLLVAICSRLSRGPEANISPQRLIFWISSIGKFGLYLKTLSVLLTSKNFYGLKTDCRDSKRHNLNLGALRPWGIVSHNVIQPITSQQKYLIDSNNVHYTKHTWVLRFFLARSLGRFGTAVTC